jgi:hypothetical protein
VAHHQQRCQSRNLDEFSHFALLSFGMSRKKPVAQFKMDVVSPGTSQEAVGADSAVDVALQKSAQVAALVAIRRDELLMAKPDRRTSFICNYYATEVRVFLLLY